MRCSPVLRAHLEAGCDEVGRGALAGPVVADSVILPRDVHHTHLKDSKQLSPKKRKMLAPIIKQQAVAWSVGVATPQEIDRINILQATYLAMHRAIANLSPLPQLLLIDGKDFKPYVGIPHRCIVKGDTQLASIAAASILAKTYRDVLMCKLAQAYPGYSWETNMGYPTQVHRSAIPRLGVTPYHRKSFCLPACV